MPDQKNPLTYRLLYEDAKLYIGLAAIEVSELELLVRVAALTRAVEEELHTQADAKYLLRSWIDELKEKSPYREHAPAPDGEIKF